MAWDSSSTQRTSVRALSPRLASATPKNIENTTICRISLLAIASANDLGTRWFTNSLSVNLPVAACVAWWVSGSGRPRLAPGWSTLARTRPRASETSEAVRNHAMALRNTRPTAAASPMWAMPTTSVEKTSGAISILISRRKMSERIDT